MKKNTLIALLFLISKLASSQSIELGIGRYGSTQNVFRSGTVFHAGIAYKIKSRFVLGLGLDYLRAPDANFHHDALINYGEWDNPNFKPDTFYNIDQNRKYTILSFLLNPRIYSSSSERTKIYCALPFGISLMTEKITYSGRAEYLNGKYNVAAPSFGFELGTEISLNKKRELYLQASGSAMFMLSKFIVTDIYMPPFAENNTLMLKCRVGLVWYFKKKQAREI